MRTGKLLTMSVTELNDCQKIGGSNVEFVNRCSRLLRELDAQIERADLLESELKRLGKAYRDIV
jgi:hypothetical protein